MILKGPREEEGQPFSTLELWTSMCFCSIMRMKSRKNTCMHFNSILHELQLTHIVRTNGYLCFVLARVSIQGVKPLWGDRVVFPRFWHRGHWQVANKTLFMRHLSVSAVPNLGKTTRSPQSDVTPWILTLVLANFWRANSCHVVVTKTKGLTKTSSGNSYCNCAQWLGKTEFCAKT